jgi:hypothetical protein
MQENDLYSIDFSEPTTFDGKTLSESYRKLLQKRQAFESSQEASDYAAFDMYDTLDAYGRDAVDFILYGGNAEYKRALGDNKYRINLYGRIIQKMVQGLASKYYQMYADELDKQNKFSGNYMTDVLNHRRIKDVANEVVFKTMLTSEKVIKTVLQKVDSDMPPEELY